MRPKSIFTALYLYPSDTERTLPTRAGTAGLRHKLRHNSGVSADAPLGETPPRLEYACRAARLIHEKLLNPQVWARRIASENARRWKPWANKATN
jgi:hypothetical protein